jgi:hypothetical protein
MCSLFSRVVKAARHAPRRSRAGSCQKAIERSDITEPCPSGLFGLEHLCKRRLDLRSIPIRAGRMTTSQAQKCLPTAMTNPRRGIGVGNHV